MRVAVVDVGSNSTRLLVADVAADGTVAERDRRSTVTRLAEGVDATGRLGEAGRRRVLETLAGYAEAVAAAGAARSLAVLTSAVRDAANGPAFARTVGAALDAPVRTLSGEAEARLTFAGAMAGARQRGGADGAPTLVADVGGGSTELVVGAGDRVEFHASLQLGVVRQTERHLGADPPAPAEVAARRAGAVPDAIRRRPARAIAVAGTATSCAAIAQGLDPYDPARVEGYGLGAGALREQAARLAALGLAAREALPGLHPARAPTIVAGALVLDAILAHFALPEVVVSDRDLLWGAARALARPDPAEPPER